MTSLKQNLERQLTGDEGNKATVYKDSLGYWTIGIGRLVDPAKKGSGLRQSEIAFMLSNDIDERTEILRKSLPWFGSLSDVRAGVLINMSFQLGVAGLLAFTTTLRRIQEGDFEGAAVSMLHSKWAMQTPGRAKRLATQLATNTWQFTKGT